MNFQTVALAACLYGDEFDIKGSHWMKTFRIHEKFSYALPVNEVVSTLIMRQFISLVITLESVTFNSDLRTNYRVLVIINIHPVWSRCQVCLIFIVARIHANESISLA